MGTASGSRITRGPSVGRRSLVAALSALAAFWLLASPSTNAQPVLEPQSDEYYNQILALSGDRIAERRDVDLNGDGLSETLLLAVGLDCASCRPDRLVIFSGHLGQVEVADLDEPQLGLAEVAGTVLISQPIRLPDEPLVAPSGIYVLQLRWDPAVAVVRGVRYDGRFLLSPNVVILTAPGPGGPPGDGPRHAVATYYSLLNAMRYEQAYTLLTDEFRAGAPYDSWEAEARARGHRHLVEVAPVPQTSGRVRVRIEEADRASLAIVERRYGGVWQTTPIDASGYAWRLGSFDPE